VSKKNQADVNKIPTKLRVNPPVNGGTDRSLSFGPEKRIKKRKDFLDIQKNGKKWKTDHFLVVSHGYRNSEQSRLGITVTRKVHKRAVKRNLLKRRVREIIRKLYHFLQEPLDIVVIAHKEATNLEYHDIKRELNYALRRLGALENKRPSGKKSK
jgi:ribonuclease P protein component